MPDTEEILLAFYSDDGRDVQGRTHAQILGWSDAALEAVHDYIQWLFPLPEPSWANPMAPLLTALIVEAFRSSPEMRGRLRAAWVRMLRFYGLSVDPGGTVVRSSSFEARAGEWVTPGNHNYLRLTRILRSLRLLGLGLESAALFAALEEIYKDEQQGLGRISAETFAYWQRAGS